LTIRERKSSIRFIERVYWPRITGLGFAFIAVSAFLIQGNAPYWLWFLLVSWGLIWPHIAFIRAKKSKDPFKCEVQNLFIDAFMIGFWVPVMSFSLVPSIGIICMHLLSIISVLGLRKASLGLVVESLGILISVSILGFNVIPKAEIYMVLASLPMITIYPLIVGFNAYNLAIKLAAKQAVLRQLSRIDGLTGLNNRTYWIEQLDYSFMLNKRDNTKASIAFVDVDHFKKINDNFGHLIGDEVLQKLAYLILKCARETDVCGRYGGEEFCILMPNTDKNAAEKLSERLRERIAESDLHEQHQIKGSISLGVAEISDSMECCIDWLNAADKALYQAKSQGRNCTVVASID